MNIEQLIQLSPVPIKFVHGTNNFLGRYCDGKHYEEYPCIKIVNNLKNHKTIVILVHEIGHAICSKKRCECETAKDYVKREVHACEYQLNWLLKHKQKKSLKWSINTLNEWLDRYDHYTEVAKHIMELKLWQKCLDYVK